MQYGLFMMPMHLPEKPLAQAFDEDIDLLIRADALGYHEAWIGEHFTSAWESIPAPDLLIARIVPHIHQMRLGTGVVLLQFHHPVLVANRLAYLDHLTKGRLYFGFGSGGLPTDARLFGIPMDGRARSMTRESVEIILALHWVIILAVVMSLILVLIGTNRFLGSAAQQHRTFGWLQMVLLFLVGIWAGLIVLDSYTYLLLTLVLAIGYDLVGANAMKAVTGIGFTSAAIVLFADRAEVAWVPGILMSVGAMAGAWLGAQLAARERSKMWVFRVLIVTIVGEIVRMLWR